MRVWILALLFLLWTGCDTVHYGSDLCEGDSCESSSDNKENPKDPPEKEIPKILPKIKILVAKEIRTSRTL